MWRPSPRRLTTTAPSHPKNGTTRTACYLGVQVGRESKQSLASLAETITKGEEKVGSSALAEWHKTAIRTFILPRSAGISTCSDYIGEQTRRRHQTSSEEGPSSP